MSRQNVLLVVAAITAIGAMVYFHEYQSYGIRGVGSRAHTAGAARYSALDKSGDIEQQAGTDNNMIDGVSMQAAKAVNQPKPVAPEQLVLFENWKLDTITCPNKPEEAPPQDNNSPQQSLNIETGQSPTTFTTPQSALDDMFKNTTDLYKGLASRLNKQNLKPIEYNKQVHLLQAEYDNKVRILFKVKQNIDTIQKLINDGSVPSEEGKSVMWQLVLPDAKMHTIFAKPKAPPVKITPPKKLHGFVTAILHTDSTPLVVIDGDIYSEGATVRGVKIVKIHPDSVEFDKEGTAWNQKVHESPSENWP